VNYRLTLLSLLILLSGSIYAQHQLSKASKAEHLANLKDGVLLIRLSDQTSKFLELEKRGQNSAAQTLKKEIDIQNEQIKRAFKTHFDFCKIHFIKPQDTKSILRNKSIVIVDISTNEKIDLSVVENIYVTDFSYGHPAEGNERYNRKGFQILSIENGELRDPGRDLFYAGVKQGIFSPNFEKSLQKTIVKFNKRLHSGKKYFTS